MACAPEVPEPMDHVLFPRPRVGHRPPPRAARDGCPRRRDGGTGTADGPLVPASLPVPDRRSLSTSRTPTVPGGNGGVQPCPGTRTPLSSPTGTSGAPSLSPAGPSPRLSSPTRPQPRHRTWQHRAHLRPRVSTPRFSAGGSVSGGAPSPPPSPMASPAAGRTAPPSPRPVPRSSSVPDPSPVSRAPRPRSSSPIAPSSPPASPSPRSRRRRHHRGEH